MSTNKRALLAIEVIWALLGVICLYITVKELIAGTGREALMFGVMTVVAFFMAWIRDRQRKKI